MTKPHIIRTVSEILDLPYQTVLLTRSWRLTRAHSIRPLVDLPAVVVPISEQLRAAGEALQEAIYE